MTPSQIFAVFASPVPGSLMLFAVTLAVGYLVDFRLRAASNSRTLRVVVWLSLDEHAEAVRDGRLHTTKSGWGPLTGLPPQRYRVWAWIYRANSPRTSFGIAPCGVAFDCRPGERVYRFLSKTVGPTVAVRAEGEWLSLSDRNPDFSPRTQSADSRAHVRQRHYSDHPVTSAVFLALLCYVTVLAPVLSFGIFAVSVAVYYLSLKVGGVA